MINIFLTLCIITILLIIIINICHNDFKSQIIAILGISIAACISYMGKKNKVEVAGGSENDSNFEESEQIKELKKIYKDFLKSQELIYEYKQIPRKIKYSECGLFANTNCHLGQRKLLLTEIEFYTKCLKSKSDKALVIYAGSASCEHLPVILDMFPNLKFILVDPNYHSIDEKYPFEYIYQNVSIIEKRNLNLFKSHLKEHRDRGLHLKKTTELLKTTKFLYDDEFNVLETATKYMNEDESENMDSIKDRFYNNDYKKLIPDIMKSKKRVFIIQDYMTELLSEKISKSKDKTKLYFLTDIRTNIYNGDSPHDIDILWNYALQIIYLKILQPEFSMLKFRPPFMMDIHSPQTREMEMIIKTDSDEWIKKSIKNDFETVKNKYKLDIFGEYLKGKFKYFKNDFIYIQPWGRVSTTEARLFVSKKNINEQFIPYYIKEWEDKFLYIKFLRMHGFHKNYYNISGISDYDGCYDCSREQQILGNYILDDNNVNSFIDNKKIIKIIKKNKKKMKEYYDLINKYTYFDLSKKNYKCKLHGNILKVPTELKVITKYRKYIMGEKINDFPLESIDEYLAKYLKF